MWITSAYISRNLQITLYVTPVKHIKNMIDERIRKKGRGGNRISVIKIKRIADKTTLYIKLCKEITELLKGEILTPSETLVLADTNRPAQVYDRTNRWHEIVKGFNDFAVRENMYIVDTKEADLIKFSGNSPTISIYSLRLANLDMGIEMKLPRLMTISALEMWSDKISKLLTNFYRSYIEKAEIEVILKKPVI